MKGQRHNARFDPAKLHENAITSIRLGVEDFESCTNPEGDPARALSAVRNLFAGVLLIFKYKIATCVDDPVDAESLIFNPPVILPKPNGNGGVEWSPSGNFKSSTIDVVTIQKRFEEFGINTDWDVIRNLQECRNHLEHLHPANTLGEVADFVAALFPVLRDFITDELEESPSEILGDAWKTMLKYHEFFVDTTTQCEDLWDSVGVPQEMAPLLKKCKCLECASTLLSPESECLDSAMFVGDSPESYKATCRSCESSTLIVPLMLEILHKEHSHDPRDGDEASIEQCYQCEMETFLINEQYCMWCAYELEYQECERCSESLGQEDQLNEGLCGYCVHVKEKYMRED